MTFLDTGFLFALVSKKDAHHARVVEVFRSYRNLRLADHLLTTNHVIAETITLTLKIGHDQATRIGEQLYAEKLARIHWASPEAPGAPRLQGHIQPRVADRATRVSFAGAGASGVCCQAAA